MQYNINFHQFIGQRNCIMFYVKYIGARAVQVTCHREVHDTVSRLYNIL